jgi:hypothetical protein
MTVAKLSVSAKGLTEQIRVTEKEWAPRRDEEERRKREEGKEKGGW